MDSNEAREEATQLPGPWYWQDYLVLAYVWKDIRPFSLARRVLKEEEEEEDGNKQKGKVI